MFSRIHEKLGTAGLIVAIVALIAALTGTALAAAGLNGKQKKQVTKIAKKYAGLPARKDPPARTAQLAPPATAGPSGATGPAGSPWVVGTAPANVILKGTWSIQAVSRQRSRDKNRPRAIARGR